MCVWVRVNMWACVCSAVHFKVRVQSWVSSPSTVFVTVHSQVAGLWALGDSPVSLLSRCRSAGIGRLCVWGVRTSVLALAQRALYLLTHPSAPLLFFSLRQGLVNSRG